MAARQEQPREQIVGLLQHPWPATAARPASLPASPASPAASPPASQACCSYPCAHLHANQPLWAAVMPPHAAATQTPATTPAWPTSLLAALLPEQPSAEAAGHAQLLVEVLPPLADRTEDTPASASAPPAVNASRSSLHALGLCRGRSCSSASPTRLRRCHLEHRRLRLKLLTHQLAREDTTTTTNNNNNNNIDHLLPLTSVQLGLLPGVDRAAAEAAWASLSLSRLLLRTADTLHLADLSLPILSCHPTLQGLLHPTTSITLTPHQPKPRLPPTTSAPPSPATPRQPSALASPLTTPSPSWARGLLATAASPASTPLPNNATALRLLPLHSPPSAALPTPTLYQPFSPASTTPTLAAAIVDATHCLLLAPADLRGLGLSAGAWAEVSINGAATAVPPRLVQLSPAPASSPASMALAPPHLFFHLTGHPSSTRSPHPPTTISLRPARTPPPPAAACTLARVAMPHVLPAADHTEALAAYFQTPRLLTLGDVLAVPTSSDAALDPREWPRRQHAWFKVVALSPSPTALVSQAETRLALEGTVNAAIFSSPNPAAAAALAAVDAAQLQELESLLASLRHPLARELQLSRCVLLHGPPGSDTPALVEGLAAALGLHVLQSNCFELAGDTAARTEARLAQAAAQARRFHPSLLLLTNVEALVDAAPGPAGAAAPPNGQAQAEPARVAQALRALGYDSTQHEDEAEGTGNDPASGAPPQQQQPPPLIVIGTTTAKGEAFPAALRSAFAHAIELESPAEEQRLALLRALQHPPHDCRPSVDLAQLAKHTAGFVTADLRTLVTDARRRALATALAAQQPASASPLFCPLTSAQLVSLAGTSPGPSDYEQALAALREQHASSLGVPQIPNVSWEDIGGLSHAKRDILDTIQLPLEHPELVASGLRRSGVLLYGPPGTGKTLLAKAVATECALSFLSVKGPELINMYVGQSEANIRAVFERARAARPCVIFFDELDSLAPNRGRSGDSGGVMDRVVSQLLAELDGMTKSNDVFVVGATNRPDLLDPALLRPGRLDRLIYLGISRNDADRLLILRALTRKFPLAPAVDLSAVAAACPPTCTGADLYALCSDAILNGIMRSVGEAEENGTDPNDAAVVVQQSDFEQALARLEPSVSAAELKRYEALRRDLETAR